MFKYEGSQFDENKHLVIHQVDDTSHQRTDMEYIYARVL